MDFRAIPADARESVWHAADGYEIRRIDWAAPEQPRGSILFLPGRGESYEKYLETFDHWRLRGWQVTSADWRGQAGSGRLGADNVTGHIGDFSTWVDDLAHFWRDWAAQRKGLSAGPVILVGHSMGGHVVLRALAEQALSPQPDALVLCAPMLDVLPDNVPLLARTALAQIMCLVGDPRRPAWKWSERPGELPPGRQLLLTHDDRRYADELWWRRNRPELVMGPGSWGWVRAALRSVRVLNRRHILESVATPVMMLATSADKLVSRKAIIRAMERLPHVETLTFGEDARHEILREVDAVRGPALDAVDAFLDRLAPQ